MSRAEFLESFSSSRAVSHRSAEWAISLCPHATMKAPSALNNSPQTPIGSAPGPLLNSLRLILHQIRLQRDLGVEQFRHRTAALGFLCQFLEFFGVDAGHFAFHLKLHGVDRPAFAFLGDRDIRARLQPLGRMLRAT